MRSREPWRSSFATRSFLGVVALFAVVLAMLLGWAALRNLHQERAAVETRAESQARFMATVSAEAMFFRDFLTLETLVRQAVEDPGIVHAVFIDTDGSAMTRFVQSEDPRIEMALDGAATIDNRTLVESLERQRSLGVVRVAIISEDVRLGEVQLVYSVEAARSAAVTFFVQAALISILALGLIMILTVMMFRRSVQRPLHHLTTRVERLADGHFTDAPEVTRVDEIGVLEQAFNDMASDLHVTLAGMESAKDDAERADRTKSEFLANMSHEIRTPLNAVLGFADVLLDSQLTDDQRNLLTTMHNSGEALLTLLNEILDFSKLDSTGSELDVEPFSPTALVSSAVALFSAEADRKQIRLDFEVTGECPPYLLGDEGRVRQILVNLIGNAVKFTGAGVVQVRVTAAGGAGRVRFDISDTGIGIDAERADELFEPFRQGDSTTTRRFGGTGLGLAICQRLIEAMGGTIWAVGSVGVGSTFSFSLPLVAADPPSAGQSEDVAVDLVALDHPLRVLLAEDNEPNRMVATRMFSRLGYQIDLAHDGVEAVDKALTSSYDLVLMDIQMPGLDGIEAARQIRARTRGQTRPRIIAFTAHALEGDRDYFRRAGMDGFLAKPLRMTDLAAVLASTPSLLEATDEPSEPTPRPDDSPSPPSEPGDTPCEVFDLTELERLFGDDATELLIELLPVFRADAEQRVASMRDAVEQGDTDVLWKEAHTLKGSARTLAATEVAGCCEQLERLGRAGRVDTAPELLERVANELAKLS